LPQEAASSGNNYLHRFILNRILHPGYMKIILKLLVQLLLPSGKCTGRVSPLPLAIGPVRYYKISKKHLFGYACFP
jgi:hypothetical protein